MAATTTTTTITTTYHNQLGGEVSALSTDVGNVPAGLEESLAVATGLGARHPHALLRLVRLKRSIFSMSKRELPSLSYL